MSHVDYFFSRSVLPLSRAIDSVGFAARASFNFGDAEVPLKKGLLSIIGLSKEVDVTKGFLVHLLRFGVRTPHICVSEYDLANCLTDLGLLKPEVKRLVDTAKQSGEAKTAEILFSKRQVHKYWSGPSRPA